MNKQERILDVLRAPLISEKTALMSAVNQYAFEVASHATKADVKQAVEKLFDVNVENVNIVNIPSKATSFRFRAGWRAGKRKAYVRLREGQTIDTLSRA